MIGPPAQPHPTASLLHAPGRWRRVCWPLVAAGVLGAVNITIIAVEPQTDRGVTGLVMLAVGLGCLTTVVIYARRSIRSRPPEPVDLTAIPPDPPAIEPPAGPRGRAVTGPCDG